MTTRLWRLVALAALAGIPLLSSLQSDAGGGPTAAAAQGKDPKSAETCGQCHTEFHAEWKTGSHAKAWTNEVYQAAMKKKKRPQVCHGCHIPDDLYGRLGKKPKPRKDRLHEGITCVSCHDKGGVIQGPFGAKTDAHPSEKNPAFSTSGSDHLCASCHSTKIDPVLPVARDHKTYREQLGDKAKSCVECHMPAVERHLAVSIVTGKPVGEKRATRAHKILGPRDVEFCAEAFGLGARIDDKDIVVSIENLTGHRIPGLKLRKFAVSVAQLGPAGDEPLAEHPISISSANFIKVLETREFRFSRAAGASKVRINVDHVFQDKKVATIMTRTVDL